MKYEERKFINECDHLIKNAWNQGAVPLEIHLPPQLIKRFEQAIYDRLLPPRDKTRRPIFLGVPLVADRSLHPKTVVIVTDIQIKGREASLDFLKSKGIILPANMKRPSTIDEVPVAGPKQLDKDPSFMDRVKEGIHKITERRTKKEPPQNDNSH